MIVKNYLMHYKGDYFVLSDDTDYFLKIKRVWLGGLFVTYKTITYTLTPYHDYGKHFRLWDSLIQNNEPIRI